MILWLTEIIAQHPIEKTVKKWAGPRVPGINKDDAQNFCNKNGLGYCKVIGKYVDEIGDKENDYFKIEFEN